MPFKKTKPRDVQFLVGRDDQLRFFRDMILKPEDPSHNILSISGQGGVGKSTLLRHFLEEIRLAEYHEYCLAVLVNERQTTPASVIERFADQLREQGHPLKKFEDALACYKEAVRRIQVAYRDEQESLVHDVVDVVGPVVEEIPFAGGIVKGAGALTNLVLEKGRMRQFLKDAARLEDPITDLTGAFVQDLNPLADTLVPISGTRNKRSRRIVLFFDTFEQLAPDIAPWLLDHFLELEVSSNIVLVIAGRESVESSLPDDPKRWLPLLDNGVIHLLSLNVFTEEETSLYLEKRGITDAEQVRQIRQLSRGLPLYLSMLTTNPEGYIDPTASVVENFLRWIPREEVQKRQLALNAALFSLPFTKDDIAAFSYVEPERSALYHWLIGQPFIQYSPQDGRHIYHDLARDLFRRHLYQRSREDYYTARKALAHYYQRRLEALQAERSKSTYTSRSWRELVFALIQQVFLLPDEESHLLGVEYVLRVQEHITRDQDSELVRILKSLFSYELGDQATTHARSIVKHLLQHIEVDSGDDYQQWVAGANALLEDVAHIPTFPSDVIAYLYRRKGRACRYLKDYQIALVHFNHALTLLPNYANIYSDRGRTYKSMKRYEEALADFDKAIALDERSKWALAQRGETNRLMERYEEALADFDKAIALDENYKWVLASRGRTYRHMKRYEEALADFDKAIALDEDDSWLLTHRGRIYQRMGCYEEALADFDSAIALDEDYTWALTERGRTYQYMGRYEEALTDLDRVLALDESDHQSLAHRGRIYRYMKRYEEALADFERAIAFDENNRWLLTHRGRIYRLMGRHEEALTDFERAITLDENYTWALTERGRTYQRMERYEDALADFDKVIALDEKNGWSLASRGLTYRRMGRYEEALADLDRVIALDENDDWSWYHKALVYLLTDQHDLFHDIIQIALNLARSYIEHLENQNEEYYRLRFNVALYLLVDGSIEVAEADYHQLLSMCSILSRLQSAATDLEEFLAIQPANELVQNILTLVKKRIAEVKPIRSSR